MQRAQYMYRILNLNTHVHCREFKSQLVKSHFYSSLLSVFVLVFSSR